LGQSLDSVPDLKVNDILTVRSSPTSESLTIGRFARAAGVGVETIRDYQDRKLLPVPPSTGAFRHYPVGLVDRDAAYPTTLFFDARGRFVATRIGELSVATLTEKLQLLSR